MDALAFWEAPPAFVMIERTADGLSWSLPWRVIIDGKRVGHVRRGQAVSFKVAPGLRSIQVCNGLGASRPVSVEVPSGERVMLFSRPRQWSFRPEATVVEQGPQKALRNVRMDLERVA